MKDSRREQMESRLAEAERQLHADLARVLPRTAKSGESIFFNTNNLPHGYTARVIPAEADGLFSVASECVQIRESLGQPVIGSLAQKYLSACQEAATMENEHRRGPRQLSAWLLGELKRHDT